jgi:TfoX/Sxy family transcriptional regulator of competence genes
METTEERFATLVGELATCPDVEVPGQSGRRAFGSTALKVNGSIFAMVSGDRLVVKLPSERVGALIDTGTGLPYDGGKKRPMREWVAVADDDEETWATLAREALNFVRSRSRQD